MRRLRDAFTLIEVLVIVAVIAILAALLLPALSRGTERARRAYCASSLRQIVLSASLYADEHDDTYPAQAGDGLPVREVGGDGTNYYNLLMPLLGNPRAWVCPSTMEIPGRLMAYHMNGLIVTTNGLRASAIGQPSNTLLMGETGHRTRFDEAYLRPNQEGEYLYDRPQENHSGGSNAAFVDGHVQWYHDSQWTSNSFGVVP